jgi:hypothetical protein
MEPRAPLESPVPPPRHVGQTELERGPTAPFDDLRGLAMTSHFARTLAGLGLGLALLLAACQTPGSPERSSGWMEAVLVFDG